VPSLKRSEAVRRAAAISVTAYEIALDLPATQPTFASTTRIRFTCRQPGVEIFVDVKPESLVSVVLNGAAVDVSLLHEGRLPLRGLREHNELVVEAIMAYSHDGEGLHRHVDPADGNVYLYAMSFLDAAPRWFACFDQPDLKAPVTIEVTCSPEWTVVGNGAATREAPGHWRLATTRPLAPYFTTLIAGPYHSVRAEHDGVPLGLHCRASLAEHLDRDADELLTITRDCLDEFHRLFGVRYPWGEYHQAFVPEFNAGAMENPGCVTYRDLLVFRSRATDAERGQRASTIAHEMAHMWFGDLVTMRWWDDLWLNESFAEYLGHRVCDAVTDYASWVEFGIVRKAWGYTADRRPSTHPVAGNGAADAAMALNNFDGISYAKGASVLRQLAAYLGEKVFLTGLRSYFAQFAYGNATLADLLAAWTAAGAVDLPRWADAWLRTSGMDTLRVMDGSLHRESAPGSTADRPHAVVAAGYDEAGRRISQLPIVLQNRRTPLSTWYAAFVLPDSNDETWAKTALNPKAWPQLAVAMPGMEPLARVSAWNALRLAVADAEVSPSLAIDVVAAAITSETDDAVVSSVLGWAERTTGCYLDLDNRPAAASKIAEAGAMIAANAPARSGLQLAGARRYIANTANRDALRGWLTGDGVPDGLSIDAELRWAVLQRLAALGALDADEIAAEAAADGTSQGAVHAAKCLALRPHLNAKQEAWQALMHDDQRPNYELYAIAGGFWHPLQEDVTVLFVERYFHEIVELSKIRSGWVLTRLAEYLYPWTAISPITIEFTDAVLARTDLDAGVRRSVLDASDDVRRALRARRAFA